MDFNKFIENYKTIVTKKYVCFEGRAGREEFWYFFLANFIVNVVLGIVGGIIRLPHLLTSLYGLAILLPSSASPPDVCMTSASPDGFS